MYTTRQLLNGEARMQGGKGSPEAYDISACSASLSREVASLVTIFLEIHHHLLHEIRFTQTLVVDCIQQTEAARQ